MGFYAKSKDWVIRSFMYVPSNHFYNIMLTNDKMMSILKEFVYTMCAIIASFLLAIIRVFVPPSRKSVKNETVLITGTGKYSNLFTFQGSYPVSLILGQLKAFKDPPVNMLELVKLAAHLWYFRCGRLTLLAFTLQQFVGTWTFFSKCFNLNKIYFTR